MFPRLTFLYNTDEQAGGGEPVAPEPTPVAEAPAPEVPSSPWDKDLEAAFTDPALRGQVSEFLRSNVQPYTTRLEQEYAPARELYAALQENPHEVYEYLTRGLYGDDKVEEIRRVLGDEAADDASEALASQGDDEDVELDPRLAELLEERDQQKAAEHYDAECKRIAGDPQYTGVDTNDDLFHQCVMVHEGDMDAAAKNYLAIIQRFQPAAPAPEAPPVLGGQPGAQSPLPTEQPVSTIDEALDGLVTDIQAKKNAPTPVGVI